MNNSLSTLLRFIIITVVLIVAALLILAVAGVLSSDALQRSVTKIAEVAVIVLVAAGITLLVAKK